MIVSRCFLALSSTKSLVALPPDVLGAGKARDALKLMKREEMRKTKTKKKIQVDDPLFFESEATEGQQVFPPQSCTKGEELPAPRFLNSAILNL